MTPICDYEISNIQDIHKEDERWVRLTRRQCDRLLYQIKGGRVYYRYFARDFYETWFILKETAKTILWQSQYGQLKRTRHDRRIPWASPTPEAAKQDYIARLKYKADQQYREWQVTMGELRCLTSTP